MPFQSAVGAGHAGTPPPQLRTIAYIPHSQADSNIITERDSNNWGRGGRGGRRERAAHPKGGAGSPRINALADKQGSTYLGEKGVRGKGERGARGVAGRARAGFPRINALADKQGSTTSGKGGRGGQGERAGAPRTNKVRPLCPLPPAIIIIAACGNIQRLSPIRVARGVL